MLLRLIGLGMLVIMWSSVAMASEISVDALVSKLVQKGILTQDDAQSLKDEIAKEEQNKTHDIIKEAKAEEIPSWVRNTKISGDFRVRNQLEHRRTEDATENTRDRGRMRYRLGVETKVNDKVNVAAGIASDGGTPRSTNQTFDRTFSKGNVVLNYAYAQYKPNDAWTLTGGQMKNPIWEPLEFLWDADMTPTGGVVKNTLSLNKSITLTTQGSVYVIKDLTVSNADPFMVVGQVSLHGDMAESKADYTLSGLYHGVINNSRITLDSRSSPNTNTTTSGEYNYRYLQPVFAAEIGFNQPFGDGMQYIPRIAAFGEFTRNFNPEDESVGWMSGVYIGKSKIENFGDWKATWAYKSLGRDAWMDVFPDGDFYGGATDVRGHESILEFGLAKNVSMAFDYYRTRRKSSLNAKAEETLIQTDLNFKF